QRPRSSTDLALRAPLVRGASRLALESAAAATGAPCWCLLAGTERRGGRALTGVGQCGSVRIQYAAEVGVSSRLRVETSVDRGGQILCYDVARATAIFADLAG